MRYHQYGTKHPQKDKNGTGRSGNRKSLRRRKQVSTCLQSILKEAFELEKSNRRTTALLSFVPSDSSTWHTSRPSTPSTHFVLKPIFRFSQIDNEIIRSPHTAPNAQKKTKNAGGYDVDNTLRVHYLGLFKLCVVNLGEGSWTSFAASSLSLATFLCSHAF